MDGTIVRVKSKAAEGEPVVFLEGTMTRRFPMRMFWRGASEGEEPETDAPARREP